MERAVDFSDAIIIRPFLGHVLQQLRGRYCGRNAVEAGYVAGSLLVAMLDTSPDFRDVALAEHAEVKAPTLDAERCRAEAEGAGYG
ncbi:hypothetical protein HMP09_2117 [Sphingomonas sp. HMP9]|nr:hypothetical protein HMP09_2117 [Sphingomonas sp. HMP9]